jgi:hypothetical protein
MMPIGANLKPHHHKRHEATPRPLFQSVNTDTQMGTPT